jgi:outer membrane protein assembly factor BamB
VKNTIGWLAVTAALVVAGPRLLRATQPGQKLWEFTTGGPVYSSPAVTTDGTVYIGSDDHKVYALDGATGAKRWEFDTGAEVKLAPVIGADGAVFVRPAFKPLYALDGATGQKLRESWGDSLPMVAADGTLVTVGESGTRVRALDGATWTERWAYQSISAHDLRGIDARGDVYLYYFAGWPPVTSGLLALEGRTGKALWSRSETDFDSPVIGGNGTLYILGESPQVIGPAGVVYARASGGKLYALEGTTGIRHREYQIGGEITGTPALAADGTLYLGSSDQKLYALEAATSKTLWTFRTGGEIWSSPAIGPGGAVIVGSLDKKVYALQGTSGLAQSPWPKFRANAGNTGCAREVPPEETPPWIIFQPLSCTNQPGSTATLRVLASGKAPLSFQWRKGTVPLAESARLTGTTTDTLTITLVQPGDAGVYSVAISNVLGTAISQEATLTVPLSQQALGVASLAGRSTPGFADGPGPDAQFGAITALDLGPQGWLYVADAGNHRVRVVDEAGAVTTWAGTGEAAQRDGPASTSAFGDLRALSVDGLGNGYVLDGDRLRRVSADGGVSTLETIALPSGFPPYGSNPPPRAWGVADTNFLVSALVASPSGRLYLLAQAGQTNWEGPYPTIWTERSVTLTRVLEGIGDARHTVFAAASTSFWNRVSGSRSGERVTALARGDGEELLVCREMASGQPQVLVLGRTPELTLESTNLYNTTRPAGMVLMTPDSVLMNWLGQFYLLRAGRAPSRLTADYSPGIGLAVDRHGFLYSATSTQVLRFIPASTVALSLLPQHPQTGGARLLVISRPGRQVRLEQSRDFAQWEPRQTLSSTGQDVWELQPEFDRLFLRAVLLP